MKRMPNRLSCHYCKKQGKDVKARIYHKINLRTTCNNCFEKHWDFFHKE